MLVIVAKKRNPFYAVKILFTILVDRLLGPFGYKLKPGKQELLFWEKQFIGVGTFSSRTAKRVDRSTQRLLFPDEILLYCEKIKKKYGTNYRPKVLDVGAGPISLLSWGHHTEFFDLVTVDILALSYRELLYIYGYQDAIGSIESVQSTSEEMDSCLKWESFDIVYCNNALDHTVSPRRSLENMVKVVREGGYILISGRSHEGLHEGYDGVHIHDLFIKDNELWRSGKDDKKGQPLVRGLPLTVVKTVTSEDLYSQMLIVFNKLSSDL